MTTTEHAELIERLESLHDRTSDRETRVTVRSAIAALRTSYRDGWLACCDLANEKSDLPGLYAIQPVNAVVKHLRRNAPQEATDEA